MRREPAELLRARGEDVGRALEQVAQKIDRRGRPIAIIALWIGSICILSSSGIEGLFALYFLEKLLKIPTVFH